jgi:hypothetical protein
MPQSDALQLKDYPAAMVRLACTRCPRRGQYRVKTLIAEYGEDIPPCEQVVVDDRQ